MHLLIFYGLLLLVPVLLFNLVSTKSKWLSSVVRSEGTWGFLGLVAAAAYPGTAYLEGRLNVLPILDLATIPALVCCTLVLFLMFARSLVTKRRRMRTTGIFLVSLVAACASVRIPSSKPYFRGFRDFATSTLSPEEWRKIGEVARKDFPAKTDSERDHYQLRYDSNPQSDWSNLSANTAIDKLDLGMTISVYRDGVSLTWGGALVGHHGVEISSDGKDVKEEDAFPNHVTVPIASDIAVFMTAD